MNKILIIAIIAIPTLSLLVFLNMQPDSKNQTQNIIKNNSEINKSDIKAHDVESILSLCNLDEHCMVEALMELSKQQDEQIIYDTISELMFHISQAESFCHTQGHHIGSFLYAYTQDLQHALSIADRKCGGSMYHGIVETYFMTEILLKDTDKDDIQIKDSCNELAEDWPLLYNECVHGIGHGLLKAYGDISPAVARCDEFQYQIEQDNCQQGVFMENVVEFYITGGGIFDEDDLLYPCNQLDSKYAANCYYYHASYILKKTLSASKSFEQCNRLIDENLIQICYIGIGRQLGASITPFQRVIDYCQAGNPDYHEFCFKGIIILITDQLETDKGFQTCAIYPEQFQEECFSFMGSWVSQQNFSRDQIIEECNKAGVQHYDVCLQSAFN